MGNMLDERTNGISVTLNSVLNNWLKAASDFLARRKGLPVLVGVALIALGLCLNLLPPWPVVHWFARTQFFLHVGTILGLLGILIGDAL